MARMTKWITSRRYFWLLMEFLIGNRVSEALLTAIIRATAKLLDALALVLGSVFRVSLEDLIVAMLKLPLIRQATLRLMAMLQPSVSALEPEIIWFLKEALRVRGVKEVILPLAMSTGNIIEHLAAPDVVYKMGRKRKR